MTESDIVWDVGAYYGKFTLPLAAKGAFVYAFEPNLYSFSKLTKNIRLNGFSNVRPYNIGLSQSMGILDFFISSDPARSSFQRYNATRNGARITKIKPIQVETIDNLMEQKLVNPPKYIKIDAEGHELEVLVGGQKTIKKYKPVIHLEPHEVRDGCHRQKEFDDFFRMVEYRIIEHGNLWICESKEV